MKKIFLFSKTKVIESKLPDCTKYGRVLVLESAAVSGRFIYDIAIRLIEIKGALRYDNFEFATPFAIYALRFRGEVRVLFFSLFKNANKAFPVKYFVPHCDKQVGSCSSIWQTYSDDETAIKAINETIQKINQHFGEGCKEKVENI